MELANWSPVKDYAKKHRISVQAVYQAIKRGSLPSRKLGTYILVYEDV